MIKRIAVLVSGGGTNLQQLINAEQSGQLRSGKIVLVIASDPKAYALTRARTANIPAFGIDRKELELEAFETQLIALLDEYKIDYIVLAGFLTILSKSFTRNYPRRILNVHPALIPSFCGRGFYGLWVHKAVLAYGCKVSGATIHFVDEVPDGGEIIAQKAVDVLPGDTPETLQKRIMEEAEWVLLPQAVELVCSGALDD